MRSDATVFDELIFADFAVCGSIPAQGGGSTIEFGFEFYAAEVEVILADIAAGADFCTGYFAGGLVAFEVIGSSP